MRWLLSYPTSNCTAVQDPTVRDLMGAISSPVNTPIGALVIAVVVDEAPRASKMMDGGGAGIEQHYEQ
jgi:hypothetical protein